MVRYLKITKCGGCPHLSKRINWNFVESYWCYESLGMTCIKDLEQIHENCPLDDHVCQHAYELDQGQLDRMEQNHRGVK
jgi:hypothetical protein